MKRRTFLLSSVVGGVAILNGKKALPASPQELRDAEETSPFTLPDLPYGAGMLEPYIDKMTMDIHHDKHHGAYVANLNKAVAGTEWASKPIGEILASVSKLPPAVRNNGGGHFNHSLFWSWMKPKGGGDPEGELTEAIRRGFGSLEKFRDEFAIAAMTRFGSGWAWLVAQHGKLVITSTPNQDNPMMDISDVRGIPVLGLDVWEHAYYLKYQNRRADYVAAWWNVVNWQEAARQFEKAD